MQLQIRLKKYTIISVFLFYSGGGGIIVWLKTSTCESQHPGSSLSGRSIGRSVERHTVPACFLLCNFRANINTLRSTIALHSRLGFVYWCLYILRKQTNQYQSFKFSWLRVTSRFKWNGCLLLVIEREKKKNCRVIEKQMSTWTLSSFLHSKNLGN